MALIICPECGREISDKAASCPGCGYPVEDMLCNNRSNEEKLVDEVWKKYSNSKTNCIRELQKQGMNLKTAKMLVDLKFNSKEAKQVLFENKLAEKERRQINKENLHNSFNTLANLSTSSKVVKCPKCHSTSISYDTKKLSLGRAAVGGAVAGAPGAVLGGLTSKKKYAVCLKCGKRWKI